MPHSDARLGVAGCRPTPGSDIRRRGPAELAVHRLQIEPNESRPDALRLDSSLHDPATNGGWVHPVDLRHLGDGDERSSISRFIHGCAHERNAMHIYGELPVKVHTHEHVWSASEVLDMSFETPHRCVSARHTPFNPTLQLRQYSPNMLSACRIRRPIHDHQSRLLTCSQSDTGLRLTRLAAVFPVVPAIIREVAQLSFSTHSAARDSRTRLASRSSSKSSVSNASTTDWNVTRGTPRA